MQALDEAITYVHNLISRSSASVDASARSSDASTVCDEEGGECISTPASQLSHGSECSSSPSGDDDIAMCNTACASPPAVCSSSAFPLFEESDTLEAPPHAHYVTASHAPAASFSSAFLSVYTAVGCEQTRITVPTSTDTPTHAMLHGREGATGRLTGKPPSPYGVKELAVLFTEATAPLQ